MHMEDPCSKLVPLHSSKDSMYLDAALYAEVLDGIDKEQIDLLSENIIVDKLLEKLWDEESFRTKSISRQSIKGKWLFP